MKELVQKTLQFYGKCFISYVTIVTKFFYELTLRDRFLWDCSENSHPTPYNFYMGCHNFADIIRKPKITPKKAISGLDKF